MDDTPFAANEPAPGQTAGTAEAAEIAESRQHTEHSAIDIEALAEKVYRLMLAEIRLDRARGLASDHGGW